MSGFISSLSEAAEAVSGIVSLAFGAAGGVVLGNFSFADFEVPEQIKFGTHQSMTVHKLPGGGRVIDTLGPDPIDISWSGIFSDDSPRARAQELDLLAASGRPLPLVWGQFYYTVIIHSFEADTQFMQVPYRISCTVLRNEAQANLLDDPELTDAVGDDLVSSLLAAPAALKPVLATAQTAVALAGRLTPGSPSLSAAASAIGIARGAVSGVQSVTQGAMSLIGNVSGGSLTTATGLAGTLAQARLAAGYIGRAAANLA